MGGREGGKEGERERERERESSHIVVITSAASSVFPAYLWGSLFSVRYLRL